MRKIFSGALFFVGWVLSPLTWWNDIFINIPLSYLVANIVFYLTHLKFGVLVILSYWATNVLGIFLMVLGGKQFILSRKNIKTAIFVAIALVLYSILMVYLDKAGKLHPIDVYFAKILQRP